MYRPIGAEHAAIAGLGAQKAAAVRALVKELAGIGWHSLDFFCRAIRTRKYRFENHGPAHTKATLKATRMAPSDRVIVFPIEERDEVQV